jgi:AcrR family transcriptional regulator
VRDAWRVAEPLTRDRIVEATRSMIQSGGLESVSLRRVAKALGVTAPALYAYVSDKEDLLRSVAEGEFDRLMAAFDRIDETDPIERIRRLGRAYVDHAVADPALFRTMFLFPPELAISQSTGQELPAATKAFEMALGATTDAVEQGIFPDVDPLTAALTTWTAMHGLADILLLGFVFDDTAREELIETVIDTMIAGLRAR